MVTKHDVKTALYRYYDDQWDLLYVGISNEPWRRYKEHERKKAWFPHMNHMTVTWYESEPAARRAETRAIMDEHPRLNIAGVPAPIPVRFVMRAETLLRACIAAIAVAFISVDISVWVPSSRVWMDPVCVPATWVFVALLLAFWPTIIKRLGAWLERHIVPLW